MVDILLHRVTVVHKVVVNVGVVVIVHGANPNVNLNGYVQQVIFVKKSIYFFIAVRVNHVVGKGVKDVARYSRRLLLQVVGA